MAMAYNVSRSGGRYHHPQRRVGGCPAVASSTLLLLLLLSTALAADGAHFTNQFAVRVAGAGQAADRVAAKHGFVNRGQVGIVLFHSIFDNRFARWLPRLVRALPTDCSQMDNCFTLVNLIKYSQFLTRAQIK